MRSTLLKHLGYVGLQEVEGGEPGVIAHPVGSKVGCCATVQDADATCLYLILQQTESCRALHLPPTASPRNKRSYRTNLLTTLQLQIKKSNWVVI